ncbi:amidophosphoribosyltransferase [Planctomycetota bacterium]|nr:amidophosphoribosyltransferase [Planctomycetota bacterium]
MTALASWTAAALDLLLPAVCPACQVASGPGCCPACLAALPAIPNPCPWCGAPGKAPAADDTGESATDCPACRNAGLPGIASVVVVWHYAGLMAHLVGEAKACSRPAAVAALADLMPAVGESRLDDPGPWTVVPIPASGRRPGPHLGTALARTVAQRSGLPLRSGLATTRATAAQHGLNLADRARNVAALFRAIGQPSPGVVLVDDLLTSGATAVAAARALRLAGAKQVVLVCLARTQRRRER